MDRLLGKSRELTITITLFAVMAATVVLLAALLIGFNFDRQTTAAQMAAESQLRQTADRINERTADYWKPLEATATLATTLDSIAAKPDVQGHPAELFLENVLDLHRHLSSIYLGFEDGDFYQIYPLSDGRHPPETFGAPARAQYAVRQIATRDDGTRYAIWRFLDGDRRVIGSRVETDERFDPRGRPWYGEAIGRDATLHSRPYLFARTQQMGLTLSRRFDGPVPGVLGIDLTLDSLSRFLAEQRFADEAVLFLFDGDGTIIGHSERVGSQRSEPGPVTAGVVALFRTLGPEDSAIHEIDLAGKRRLLRFAPLSTELGTRHWMAIAAPLEAFTGPLSRIRTEGVVVSILLLLAALPLILWLSGQISRPLLAIARETEAIRRFDLDEMPASAHSYIREVRLLTSAVTTTKAALRTFSLYVPKDLVRQVVASGVEPVVGGDRMPITIMFTDIAGFTDLSERQDPEAVMLQLSEYLAALSELVGRHRGTIDKYIGDAIMAFWNAPQPDPQHAWNACAAALAMRDLSERLNAGWLAAGRSPLPTRFGLHSGEAIVGNIGGSDRMNYTAIGAAVNLAARLEGLNKRYGTGILVSGAVARRIEGRALLRELDLVRPKGVATPVSIYELRAAANDATDQDRFLCDRWQAARERYLARDWANAADLFAAIADAIPHDRPAAIFRDRSLSWYAAQPPASWDGVEVFATK